MTVTPFYNALKSDYFYLLRHALICPEIAGLFRGAYGEISGYRLEMII